MRKDKHHESEKKLCDKAEQAIDEHVKNCRICQKSFDSAKHFNIPTSPPCNNFLKELRKHVDNCSECQTGEKKWNEDAIPITPDMRLLVSQMQEGKMPDVELMKSVASSLMKELGLSSDEIGRMNQAAQDKVKELLKRKSNSEQV